MVIATRFQNHIVTLRDRFAEVQPVQQLGSVFRVRGLVVEAYGPNLSIGDLCRIHPKGGEAEVLAEVVGFQDQRMLLMPLGEMNRIGPGSTVSAAGREAMLPRTEEVKGRILDGLGLPLDGGKKPAIDPDARIRRAPPDPFSRSPIRQVFSTGVKAIDLFSPVGRGQRMGIFSGSGVGKSTLLGMLIKGGDAEVNVIALIGERGREVREFVENTLGPEDLKRSVLIVSTSDQPPMLRLRAAFLATALAEQFRDEGRRVLFLMDSVTRFAMAQREIGLSVGEPPANRGYPPSVFSLLPRLLERTGNGREGSITAFYTILVEGDDMNEPITDSVRGILDGHIVLSRAIATANHFPAVDVLESISRLNTEICNRRELDLTARAREHLAIYRRNEDLINIGAYTPNSNATIDRAIDRRNRITKFLQQDSEETCNREDAFKLLEELLS